ncbi:hypothetical protein HZB78_06435 [Candidatus Collierbacteria bacterium]|nr:hypothetical protein [Candidatus Collierbacteria bacterium]
MESQIESIVAPKDPAVDKIHYQAMLLECRKSLKDYGRIGQQEADGLHQLGSWFPAPCLYKQSGKAIGYIKYQPVNDSLREALKINTDNCFSNISFVKKGERRKGHFKNMYNGFIELLKAKYKGPITLIEHIVVPYEEEYLPVRQGVIGHLQQLGFQQHTNEKGILYLIKRIENISDTSQS